MKTRIWHFGLATYIVILNLVLVMLIARTDFIPRLNARLGRAPSPHVIEMLQYHRWMDEAVPPGSAIFLGDSNTQGLATAAVVAYATNYGIGGESASQLLAAIPTYRSLSRAGTIFLSIGTNDLSEGLRGGLDERLQRIVEALPRDRQLIWSSIMPIRPGAVDSQEIIEANNMARHLCQERGNCTFVDTWSFLADDRGQAIPKFFLADGIHLNTEGYKRWIAALKQAARKVSESAGGES